MSLPRFGVTRPVPVNLLMMAIIISGIYSGLSLRREFFPESEPEQANITLPYPGATPEEIEETLAIKIEDALVDIDEVDTITTTIAEGGGGIVVEFREGIADIDEAVDEVERAVDALTDLPEDAEEITVAELEPRLPVIMVSLFGDTDEELLKDGIRAIRDELETLPRMGEMIIGGVRDYEVRIDVDSDALIQYGISLPQVADAVSAWLADVPGGSVRSAIGTFNVRTLGVPETAEAIRDIVVLATPEGQVLRVGDIATVRESFVDTLLTTRFNSQRSATVTVFKVGDQDIVNMAEMVRAYVAGRSAEPFQPAALDRFYAFLDALTGGQVDLRTSRRQAYDLGRSSAVPLPPGTEVAVHSDLARFVEGRLDLLVENAIAGAVLVFATLLLFLNWRGAFWVGVGLLTAIAGTLVLMLWFDITLNLLTMFGLIVVLGLLVDDAIVVAENIQARHDRGEPSLQSAINGASEVGWPVVATVLTSIVAFLPLTFIRGRIGDLLGALPMVVAIALAMSLLECLLILPSHLGHGLVQRDKRQPGVIGRLLQRYERGRDRIIFQRIVPVYEAFMKRSLYYRYVSVAAATAVLIASMGLLTSGIVAYEFLPAEDAETIVVDLRMPIGTSLDVTDAIVQRIEDAATAQPEVVSVNATVGQRANIETGTTDVAATHIAQVFIELAPVERRVEQGGRASTAVVAAIREAIGPVDEAERLTFSEISGGPTGSDITLRLRGPDEDVLQEAATDLKAVLASYAGVVDIADDNALGQRELQIRLRPGAAALGFTVANVARQVRGALFGIDAHVFSAQREDIDVRVRLDEPTRRSLYAVENLWLISPAGQPVPLEEVAEVTEGLSYATIRRVDRQRAITVTADTTPAVIPEQVVNDLPLDELRRTYPAVEIARAGRQEQEADAFRSLPIGFIAACLMIYVILAWLFSSYSQPLAVMMGIPFAIIGVIWGHLILGFEVTFLSLIGFVALSGIVVNDSLILVQFYNSRRENGSDLMTALLEAGKQRLRPIFLTTVTTVLGLTPLMLETSFQARFLIPMAISIAFGLISATVLILVVLPCMLVIVDDLKRAAYYLWFGRPRPDDEPPPSMPYEPSAE